MTNESVRRQVIVQGFQRKFVAIQIGWVVAGLLVLAIILLRPLMSTVPAEPERSAVAEDIVLFHVIVWSAFVAITALLSVMFIRMSHRVAGSIHRFREAFRQIAAGRLDIDVGTRKGDYLTGERDDLNAMIVSLRARIKDSQSAVGDIDRLLADKRAQGGALSGADLETLQARAARAKTALAQFSVGAAG